VEPGHQITLAIFWAVATREHEPACAHPATRETVRLRGGQVCRPDVDQRCALARVVGGEPAAAFGVDGEHAVDDLEYRRDWSCIAAQDRRKIELGDLHLRCP